MSLSVRVGNNEAVEVGESEAETLIEEHLGIDFEYLTFDSEDWEIQLKTPGRKVVIRPTHIGREMKFEIVLC